MRREGIYHLVARSSFVKAFEFAKYCNGINEKRANEGAFFAASALRGICEDVIALRFLHKLSKELRDEVLGIELMLGVHRTSTEQGKFFESVRPFQPVLKLQENTEAIAKAKDRITQIGIESGLWRTQRKLPPLEQMATVVGMRQIYDYFYRVSSDTVHFNPGVALRNGWGKELFKGKFGTNNFCRYYLFSSQIYSIFLFNEHCQTLKDDLGLTAGFMKELNALRSEINMITRWPEAITFEEMNEEPPNEIMRALLQVVHQQGLDGKKVLEETLPYVEIAIKEESPKGIAKKTVKRAHSIKPR